MSLLADRITAVRRDLFGDDGISALVESLDLPLRTWMNYETGVVMPASVLLRFLVLTAVEPHWLLTGEGPRYRSPRPQTLPSPPITSPSDTRPLDPRHRARMPRPSHLGHEWGGESQFGVESRPGRPARLWRPGAVGSRPIPAPSLAGSRLRGPSSRLRRVRGPDAWKCSAASAADKARS